NGSANTITGNGGHNALTGGGGNDNLAGGAGIDTAVFAVTIGAGAITFASGAWQVNGGTEGIDTLSGVERVAHNGTGRFLLVGGGAFLNRAAAEAVQIAGDVILFASTPGTPTDSDGAINSVSEQAANGAVVGIDVQAATDGVGGAVTYSLSNDAGGRFAINAATGVVTVANGQLLDFEQAASHQVTVRATNALGAFSQQTFTINLIDIVPVEDVGGKGNDTLIGTPEPDKVDGGRGNDTILGGGGDDVLVGGKGKDAINGGPGVDTTSYATSTGAVKIDLGKAKQKGGDAKGDTLADIENVTGSKFADVLIGNGLGNVLDGVGDNDRLDGRGGTDTLIGGSGKDAFIFKTGYGRDTVADFGNGDIIDLSVAGPKTFKALKALMSEVDGDVVIAFGGGDTLVIADRTIGSLGKGDFDL
ncbi:MAG TPA: cadherin domain-containing protein, partial [Bauldia sp.]|nr:cadherin domain-containing protein [Bauldia sp.]